MNDLDLTAQERAARVAWQLALGERLTTRQVMELTGLTRMGAWHLLMRVSRVIPIVCSDSGEWGRMDSKEE